MRGCGKATGCGSWRKTRRRAGLSRCSTWSAKSWRHAARLWNIAIDRAYRRQGLGRELIRRGLAWARTENLRAVWLETQTNNLPACRFYQAMGFKLCGMDDHFYSNDDIGVKEVAIFWWYEL